VWVYRDRLGQREDGALWWLQGLFG
jgi:hypothetical protein